MMERTWAPEPEHAWGRQIRHRRPDAARFTDGDYQAVVAETREWYVIQSWEWTDGEARYLEEVAIRRVDFDREFEWREI